MPILWNGTKLDNGYIDKMVEPHMPTGKNKMVVFKRLNAQPFKVLGKKGEIEKLGSEYQYPALDRTALEAWGGGKNGEGRVEGGEGMMQYYETASPRPGKNGESHTAYAPNFITFFAHTITFDASTKKDLFFYLLFHSENDVNSEKLGRIPSFQILKANEKAKKTVAAHDMEDKARAQIRELRAGNKAQLRAFYEALNHDDWNDLVGADIPEGKKDWDSIYEPMYNLCRTNPAEALRMMGDSGLSVVAKVNNAINAGVITTDGAAFYWGEQVQGDVKKRLITKIPRGKGEEASKWFAEWLRDQGGLLQELELEIERNHVLSQ